MQTKADDDVLLFDHVLESEIKGKNRFTAHSMNAELLSFCFISDSFLFLLAIEVLSRDTNDKSFRV